MYTKESFVAKERKRLTAYSETLPRAGIFSKETGRYAVYEKKLGGEFL